MINALVLDPTQLKLLHSS